jgi:integrase/recombinase XerD
MTDLVPISPTNLVPSVVPHQDHTIVNRWLRSKRSQHTRKAYARDITKFYTFLIENERADVIAGVTLDDIQDYADHLKKLHPEPATQARMIASVKSLFTFAHKTGFIPFNVGAAQELPEGKDKLAERILSPAQVYNIVYEARDNPIHHALLMLLYGSGIRCEELCNLQWRDVQETSNDGQITVIGKRRKTRSIALPEPVWNELIAIKPANVSPDDYVFQSRKTTTRNGIPSRRFSERQVWHIVKDIAAKAGIKASPHFFRHAHATRAMEKGAPLKLIQDTLGHADLRTPSKYQHVRPGTSSGMYLDL